MFVVDWIKAILKFFLVDSIVNVLGDLFEPWYYLIMIGYIAALAILPLAIPRPWAMRFSGWTIAVSLLLWSIIVRGMLA